MNGIDRPDLTGPVVGIGDLQRKRLSEGAEKAMQAAFAHPDLDDPSAVQMAVADRLMALEAKSDLDAWPAIGIALVVLAEYLKETSLPLEEAVREARKVVGA
jgi:hypothetical protein